jgi:hypothetical protein
MVKSKLPGLVPTLLALVAIGAAAAIGVAADRTVLLEYFNATW